MVDNIKRDRIFYQLVDGFALRLGRWQSEDWLSGSGFGGLQAREASTEPLVCQVLHLSWFVFGCKLVNLLFKCFKRLFLMSTNRLTITIEVLVLGVLGSLQLSITGG